MNITLDPWQQQVLTTKGNVVLRSGRQVGKSTIISIKAGDYAAKNSNKTILVIASVERQALLLFEKILSHIYINHKSMIKKGKDRPTKHILKLKNGSVIHCLPTGLSGYGIRGYTIDLLIADEAAFIPEEVWRAVTPMLAITRGMIILLSTPHTAEGYFYRCFDDETFTNFHISSEDCPRKDPVFLEHEKRRMTRAQYAQEYLGEFMDELRQFFPSKLIKDNTWNPTKIEGDLYLGVDFAGYGGDQNAFVVVKMTGDDLLEVMKIETTTADQVQCNITGDTIDRIVKLNKQYHFRQIFVDDGGLGSPIFDILLKTPGVKRKVVGINNARRSIDREDRKTKLMKEDLYGNLLRLMERHHIRLLEHNELRLSLKSIQYEFTDEGKMKIFGSYTHICEALIRAAWCVKAKHLKPFVRTF